MQLEHHLGMLHRALETMSDALRQVADAHRDEPDRFHSVLLRGTRRGPLALLRDLQDLYPMAGECDIVWTVVGQAAQGVRDEGLGEVVREGRDEAERQVAWLRSRMMQAAPQALLVAR